MPRDIRYYRPGEPFEEGGALHLTRMGDLREVFVRERRDGAFTVDVSFLVRSLRASGVPVPSRQHLNVLFPWMQGDRRADGSEGRHEVLRGLLEPYFKRAAIEGLEEVVQRYAHQGVLEGARGDRGLFDLVEFARTLSFRVVSHLVGLPADQVTIVREEVAAYEQRPGLEFLEPESGQLRAFFQHLFDRAPRRGLLADLTVAHAQGLIDVDERDALVWGCYSAGLGTTATAICLLVGLVIEFGLVEVARTANQAWLETVTHEALRYATPFTVLPVFATRDVTLASSVTIREEQPLQLVFSAANRDPQEFGGDADQFLPTRRNAGRHLAFGQGVHWCLGDHLARLEMRVALQEIVSRLPRLEVRAWQREAGALDWVARATLGYQPPPLG